MKILHITNNYPSKSFPIFGIFVKEQIDALVQNGLDCEVFVINGREEGKKAYIKAIPKLIYKLLVNKYDIIHCHHVFSALVLILSFGFVKKNVLSYQNPPKYEGGELLFRIMLLFFSKIIFKHSKYPNSKVFYLPNGVNKKIFYPMDKYFVKEKLGLDITKRYILFTDSNTKKRTQKRYDRFLQVLEILKERDEKIDKIVLTNTPREMIPLYYNAVDLHLICSDFEGSPNSVKECLACNTPVVSTNVGNVYEMIHDIPGCFVSDSFSAEELAKLTIQSLKYKNFSSVDFIDKKGLTINNNVLKLKQIYEELLHYRSLI